MGSRSWGRLDARMGAGGGEVGGPPVALRRSGGVVEVVGHRLIELELWHRLGLGGIEGDRRVRGIGEEVDLGGRAGGRQGRGPVGKVEVQEDGADDRGLGEEREDPHLAATGRAEERKHLVDAREEDGPADARG